MAASPRSSSRTWADFLTFYAAPATGAAWIVPRKYLERVGDDGFKKAPVGAGPYKFVSFTPGVELVLDANEQYWRKAPSVEASRPEGGDRGDDARGDDETRRGRRRLHVPQRRGARPPARARAHGPVGSEISVGRSPRAARREPRDRPRRDEPVADARVLATQRQHDSARLRVRVAGAALRVRRQAREAAHGRGRLSERLRRRRDADRSVVRRDGGARRRLSRRHRDQDAAAHAGARGVLQPGARQEDPPDRLHGERRGRHRGDAARRVRRGERRLHVRQLSRHRARDGGADLGDRRHPGLRRARGGAGARPDHRLPVVGAVRGAPAEALGNRAGLGGPLKTRPRIAPARPALEHGLEIGQSPEDPTLPNPRVRDVSVGSSSDQTSQSAGFESFVPAHGVQAYSRSGHRAGAPQGAACPSLGTRSAPRRGLCRRVCPSAASTTGRATPSTPTIVVNRCRAP
ncbi:MAG: hypothetical protein FJZ38_16175 [Candidatus Rokubacteria bacterium]|nr:hypothetical protein [Candidatus Rokubacteria bacterium]